MRKYRLQVQLEPKEHEALRAHASRRGVSQSHVVREAVRRLLGLEDREDAEYRRRFLSAAGVGREPDGLRDVARRHDDVLYGPAR